jgi:hypothetical protein
MPELTDIWHPLIKQPSLTAPSPVVAAVSRNNGNIVRARFRNNF